MGRFDANNLLGRSKLNSDGHALVSDQAHHYTQVKYRAARKLQKDQDVGDCDLADYDLEVVR